MQTLDRPTVSCLKSTVRSQEQSIGALEQNNHKSYDYFVSVFGQTIRALEKSLAIHLLSVSL